MEKYAIAVEGEYTLQFYYDNLDGFIVLTRIGPKTFPNMKKAKRHLKRLNKYHGGDYFIVNYREMTKK